MERQIVFVASMLFGFVQISCATVLLFKLGACGSSGGSGGSSSSSKGSVGAPQTTVLLVGGNLWKTDGTAAGSVLVKDISP